MPKPSGLPKIRVTCTGAGLLALDKFSDFQGDLKSLSESAYAKLRKEILLKGISFPVAVWKKGAKHFILDGHQRLKVLNRMWEEGFAIPLIPIVYIEAKDKKEAKEKLLAAASQYGKIEGQGLYQFMHEAELEFSTVNSNFEFAEIDLPVFHAEYFLEQKEESDPRAGASAPPPSPSSDASNEESAEQNESRSELGEQAITKLDYVEPDPAAPKEAPEQRSIDVDQKDSVTYKFLPEEKQDLMYRLDDLMKSFKVTSHAEVVLALVAEAHRKLKKKK